MDTKRVLVAFATDILCVFLTQGVRAGTDVTWSPPIPREPVGSWREGSLIGRLNSLPVVAMSLI
jgi:hypothetical protein